MVQPQTRACASFKFSPPPLLLWKRQESSFNLAARLITPLDWPIVPSVPFLWVSSATTVSLLIRKWNNFRRMHVKKHTLSAQSNYLPWLTNCSTCGLQVQLFLLRLTPLWFLVSYSLLVCCHFTSASGATNVVMKLCEYCIHFWLILIAVLLNNDDDDDDDDDGRDAVGVSHAAPPRLRPPDNGNLGGATYTSCIYTLYIATYMSRIHSVFYTAVYNVYAAH